MSMHDVRKRLDNLALPEEDAGFQLESLSDDELERELAVARRELARNRKAIVEALDNTGLADALKGELEAVRREIDATLYT
jgi:hypothetical protein